VFGSVRLTDRLDVPDMESAGLASNALFMGQHLLNPPSVEGWHEGEEWVDSGALLERINFAAAELGHRDSPGVKQMLRWVESAGESLQPEEFVETCLDALGSIDLSPRSKTILVEHAAQDRQVVSGTPEGADRTIEMLQLIVSTPDYQYC